MKKVFKFLKIVGLVVVIAAASLFALLVVIAVRGPGKSQPAAAAQAKPVKQIAQRGGSYSVKDSFFGPVSLNDKDELVKAIEYDRRHVLEMVMAGRAAMVNQGDLVTVTDRDGILDVWVQVRPAGKGYRVWVPMSVLAL